MMCKDTIKIFMNNICRDKMNYINAFFTSAALALDTGKYS